MEEKIQLAALLHGIGKFWQGTSEPGSHQELCNEFIKTYVPKEEWRPSLEEQKQEVIIAADWFSSGEKEELEEKEEAEKRKNTPLTSIFSKVKIEKGELPPEHYYPIKPLALDDDILFPKEEGEKGDLTEDYKDLWTGFEKEVEKLKAITDFNAYFNTLYYLLQKYTWCIPSAVGKAKTDVALFDHLKTTCAIASCLDDLDITYCKAILKSLEGKELSEEERSALQDDKKFLLIGGDVSGVQKFIYSITSEGAVKGLRGRSFYLELLSESIAKYILRELNLPVTNLLYCGGGHFYVLAPSVVVQDLEEIRGRIAKVLLEIHRGELYLVLDWLRLSADDFQKFGDAWSKMGKKIAERKKRKFHEILGRYGDIFGPFDEGGAKPFCNVCGSEIKEGERCNFCKSLEELAKKLSEAKYIAEIISDKRWKRAKKGTWEDLLSEFGFRYEFHSELGEGIKRIDAEHICIYKLNDTKFLDWDSLRDVKDLKSHISFGFKFLAKETPYAIQEIQDIEGKIYEKEEIKEFSDLAKDSEGIKNWAVLRADVDNLGKIFGEGLGEDRTISRVSNLSSMLSLFFRGWMEKICEGEEYMDKVYAIYSGGDDLFIVGSWDRMPELGKEIYADFRAFTCINPNITLSAGITIAPSEKYPLYQAADLAGEALDKSKGLKEKDGVAFLDMGMKWDKFCGGVTELEGALKELLKAGVSRAFLQKLNEIYGEYERQRSKHGETLAKYDDRYGRWRWLLAYVIARTKVSRENERLLKETEGLIRKNIAYLPVAVRWVEFVTRKE